MERNAVLDSVDVLPLELASDGKRMRWRDVGRCPFTQSFFHWSLQAWELEHGAGASYETELAFLEQDDIGIEAIAPSAFIFHMSRCGSSALVSALAHCPRILVMSEPPAVNDVLRHLCGRNLSAHPTGPGALRILRNVIVALGRRRDPRQEYYCVKFSGWNVLQAWAIRHAFPQVPCLFVYRHPAEVMVSLLRRPPDWMLDRSGLIARGLTGAAGAEADAMMPVEFAARCVNTMMGAGLTMPRVRLLNYVDLTRERLPAILEHCRIECSNEELLSMSVQYDFDAKSFPGVARYVDDSAAKQLAASGEIRFAVAGELQQRFDALSASDANLVLASRGGNRAN